jgi:hypothetical protein
MLALYGDVRDSDDRMAIRRKKEEMLQVLVRVLDDAEEGLVTEEGFQVFSLTWQAIYGALRDRLFLGPPGLAAGQPPLGAPSPGIAESEAAAGPRSPTTSPDPDPGAQP